MARQGPSTKTQVSFNSGEWSLLTHDRIDLGKHSSACRTLQNAIAMPYGGFYSRAGTEYIATSKEDTKIRLIEFVYSTTTRYIIELGNLYMRFYSGGAQVESGGSPLEVVTPWTTAQLFDIHYQGDDDIVYFALPDVPRQKLTRLTATSFTIAAVVDTVPPLLDENETTTTIAASNTSGTVTLTASDSIFEADHVDSYWQIKHKRDANFVEFGLSTSIGTSSSLVVEGSWRFETVGTFVGEVELQERSIDGSTWETVLKVSSDGDLDLISRTGEQETDKEMRIEVTAWASGTAPARAYLENVSSFAKGLVKITAVGGPTSATATVVETLFSIDATPYWSEGAYSTLRGHPNTLSIYENRIFYGGTAYEPQTIYGSEIDEYENFPVGTLATDRLKYKLGGLNQNAIQWMVGQEDLLIGTTGNEFRLGTGDTALPLVPTLQPKLRNQSNRGSSNVQARIVGDVTLFVQSNNKQLREFVYSFENNNYKSPDLLLLSEHLSVSGITCIAYQRQPYSILWCVTEEGTLIGMTYERDQDVQGWHRHTTDGLFESVAVIPGTLTDEVWVSVKRTIGGVDKRFIERINPTIWTDQTDAFYVDSGLSYSGSAVSTLSGLTHLIGETVQVNGNGGDLGDFVVDGSGEIDISPHTVTKAHVGLGFDCRYKPMAFDIDNKAGNSQGQIKKVTKAEIKFKDTLEAKVYSIKSLTTGDEEELVDLKWREAYEPYGSPPTLKTGIKIAHIDSRASLDPSYIVSQNRPLPMTVLGITTRYEITEGDT